MKATACKWCSTPYSQIFHNGQCPRIKSIEYYKTGEIKRIVFNDHNLAVTPTITWYTGTTTNSNIDGTTTFSWLT